MNKAIRNFKAKAAAAGAFVSTIALSGMAMAQDSGDTTLSTAVTGQLSSGNAELLAIGGAILTLCGVVVLIRMARKSAS